MDNYPHKLKHITTKAPTGRKVIAETLHARREKIGAILTYKREDLASLRDQIDNSEMFDQDLNLIDLYLEIIQAEAIVSMFERRYKQLEAQLATHKEDS